MLEKPTSAKAKKSAAKAAIIHPSVDFNPIPSWGALEAIAFGVSESLPETASCVAVLAGKEGDLPSEVDVDRAALEAAGFAGELTQSLLVPHQKGAVIALVGLGDLSKITVAKIRDAAAALACAAHKHDALAVHLPAAVGLEADALAQAVVEGVVLARYRYETLKTSPAHKPLKALTLVAEQSMHAALQEGIEGGKAIAGATMLARDLANSPATHLTAQRLAQAAQEIGAAVGLDVEVFDKDALIELGCGGILGVNRGSVEPPRMIKISYKPKTSPGSEAQGSIAIVGKGVMYDSGGINLKPSDDMHLAMKLDMSGAAAVLASMSALPKLNCKNAVVGYLMCTDNMPSGSATKLGDVLTIRGGKTVEVQNTDAEGRLMLADGMMLASEDHPDVLLDIATLTGACMRALGTKMGGVLGNDQALIEQVKLAGDRVDELLWQLPLDRRYRKELDSEIADLRNVGESNAAAITAALFLDEFTNGIPWAHIDMCGPMKVDADELWRPRGATGFGTRLLIDFATQFSPHSNVH